MGYNYKTCNNLPNQILGHKKTIPAIRMVCICFLPKTGTLRNYFTLKATI